MAAQMKFLRRTEGKAKMKSNYIKKLELKANTLDGTLTKNRIR
jgi:hypothetical protein